MARFDLLRAVQGLAARVTKWSTDCDKALHRLVCYINSTLDITLNAFIGDPVSECRLWCFADSDHAGEYDNKSTTGCFLVLIGPNTYFPLTAFSKKQTSVSMSSTEAEVVAANISLRAVGLPSSGLWAYLQNAGGDPARSKKGKQSTPEGLPITSVKTEPEKDGDYWEFVRHRKFLVRVHNNSRAHLFDPSQSKTIPLSIKRVGYARTTRMITKEGVDFRQDSWKNKGEVAVEKHWTGKTFFRVYGPYEADYDIESREVREALTDWEFIGHERMGEHLVSMIPPKSIQSVFVEDNQATIRIMESGRSPTFRHTDKTQRVNLSWLSEQFRRKWYGLIHGPTMMQAADILTKPFTNGEKWAFAVKLLAHCIGKTDNPKPAKAGAPAALPSTSGSRAVGTPKRMIVEVCAHETSRISQPSSTSVSLHPGPIPYTSRSLDLNLPRAFCSKQGLAIPLAMSSSSSVTSRSSSSSQRSRSGFGGDSGTESDDSYASASASSSSADSSSSLLVLASITFLFGCVLGARYCCRVSKLLWDILECFVFLVVNFCCHMLPRAAYTNLKNIRLSQSQRAHLEGFAEVFIRAAG